MGLHWSHFSSTEFVVMRKAVVYIANVDGMAQELLWLVSGLTEYGSIFGICRLESSFL